MHLQLPQSPPSMSPEPGRVLPTQALTELSAELPTSDELTNQEWLAMVEQFLLPAEHFTAGYISTRQPLWREYFQTFGMTAKAKEILQWLAFGLDIKSVPVDSPCQHLHPRFAKRLALVQKLLEKTVGKDQVVGKLSGREPQQVQFRNRVSVQPYNDFAASEIATLVKLGVIQPWTLEEPIIVINGMGVVEERKGKLRLVVDARYINLYDLMSASLMRGWQM